MTASSEPQQEISLFMMAESEAMRLMSRCSHMDVFKKVQEVKCDFGNKQKKLQQAMYLHSVGKIPDFENLSSSTRYDSEIVEQYLEKAILYQNAVQLMEKREEFAVIEDDFGPTLEKMMKEGKQPSFQNLVDACRKYDDEIAIRMHVTKSNVTHRYFIQRGISEDNAKAYAFALAFYTGAYSWAMSMEANVVARRSLKQDQLNSEEAKVDSNAAMIMYYLIKGLSHIAFYWGVVTRYVELTDKDLQDYKPGEIVTWLQFSSSDKGGKNLQWFQERNTILTISSLTGRSIIDFSNCDQEEDEVLFLPHSSFLVCQVVYDEKHRKNQIYLRQIELGLCQYVVLWVDDNIFDEKWENKKHMEQASTLGTRVNVHFIPKSNTESALAFLRSEFGQRLKYSNTFRIVTDMKRANESDSSTAGARLIYKVRKLGFTQSCLIFTGHEESAYEKLEQLFGNRKIDGIKVTQNQYDLEDFVIFNGN
ncbi:unnamed protein product [Rotaria socialis]|uniref:NAD(P)(+)--arginine ADP-ribosyltransferase n=1 Tax=Rotaria socialis TaxID=392032 RepID=A0A817V1T3_9BILA|nr:unnamed protein product [Rotaria socialis]